MTFGSLFAGIEGFGLGLEQAGLRCLFQVEREPFCLKVLTKHWPDVPKFDDVCAVGAANLPPVDWLVGGFPCQDVSVAGKREGLSGARTGLFYEFLRIARELNVKGLILENVPGLLTSHRGRDFHAVLTALAECGFRRSYRILDSRYFGVAQRRRRVFLVCGARGLFDGAAEVLFESEGGDGDSPASRSTGPHLAGPLGGGAFGTGRRDEDDPNLVHAYTLRENERNTSQGPGNFVAATLRGRSHRDGVNMPGRGGEDDQNLVAYALRRDPGGIGQGHNTNFIAHTLRASDGHHGHSSPRGDGADNLVAATLNSGGNSGGFRTEPGEHLIAATLQRGGNSGQSEPGEHLIAPTLQSKSGRNQIEEVEGYQPTHGGVRRLTPLECERLQGFPDGWTCLCGEGHRGSQFCRCPDSPRYRALGNAVTVSVAYWIGQRLMESAA